MPFRPGSRLAEDSGQGLVEYALILALASLGIVFALLILQDSIGTTMQGASRRIDAAAAGTNTPPRPGGAVGGGAETGAGAPGADEGPDGAGKGAGKGHGKGYGRGNGKGNGGNGYGNGRPNGRE